MNKHVCSFIHILVREPGCLWPYDKENLSPEHICQSIVILISLKEEKNRRKEKEKKKYFLIQGFKGYGLLISQSLKTMNRKKNTTR